MVRVKVSRELVPLPNGDRKCGHYSSIQWGDLHGQITFTSQQPSPIVVPLHLCTNRGGWYTIGLVNHIPEVKLDPFKLIPTHTNPFKPVQDDGEAGIALVGVHSDYPKYTEDMKKDDKAPANVG
jgi:hypothetical protein